MSESWERVALADVAVIQQGKTAPLLAAGVGAYPYFGANGVIGSANDFSYDFETIGLGCRGTVGAVNTVPAWSWAGNNVMVLYPRDERVSTEYLSYWLGAADLTALGAVSGQVQKQITRAKLGLVTMSLPPRAVQDRISHVMDSIDKQIEALANEVAAAERLLDSTRDRLVLPKEHWRRTTLGAELEIVRGGSPRPIKNFITDDPDGLNWIKIGDVPADGKYIDSTRERIRPDGLSKTREVQPGDFILSNSMSFGRPYILKIAGCVHDGWLVLRDRRNVFDQDFLYHLLRSSQVQGQFEALAAGSGVRNLKRDSVKTVQVAVPNEREQRDIAAALNGIYNHRDSAARELDCLRAVRAATLNALLSREIEIPESFDSAVGLEGVA